MVCIKFLVFCAIIVQYSDALLKVTVPVEGGDLFTRTNGTFSMTCEGDSAIEWYIKGVKVDPNSPPTYVTVENTIISSNTQHVSVFKKVNAAATDEGSYSCVPSGGSVTASSIQINVKVVSPEAVGAVVTLPLENVYISCRVPEVASSSVTYTVNWLRNGQEIVDTKDKYQIISDNNTLLIESVNFDEDLGVYQCAIILPQDEVVTMDVVVSAVPFIARFKERSKNSHPGDDLQIDCDAKGYPIPSLIWSKEENLLNDSNIPERITISNEGKTLMITDITYEDKGIYYCVADSGNDLKNNRSIVVRVKNPIAVVYPIIGIVIQLVVLLVIILCYERHMKKKREQRKAEDENMALTAKSDETEMAVRKRIL